MSEYDDYPFIAYQQEQPNHEVPRHGRGILIVTVAAVAVAMATEGAIATAALWPHGAAPIEARPAKGLTPAQARLAIGGHHFDHPRIKSVTDTHDVVNGHDKLKIDLDLPTAPTAAKAMEQFAAHDAPVEWIVPSGIKSYTVRKAPKTGKYSFVGPGFESSTFPTIPGGDGIEVDHGTARIVERPKATDPTNLQVAFFATTEALTSNDKGVTKTDGEQFTGIIKLTKDGWVSVPGQMPDTVTTTFTPWQKQSSVEVQPSVPPDTNYDPIHVNPIPINPGLPPYTEPVEPRASR